MEKYKASKNGVVEEQSQEQKNQESTENLINAGLEVAEHIPVASLYAKGAKLANKLTGGALTKGAAKITNKALQNNPLGGVAQDAINQANDSGLTNAVGSAASAAKGSGKSTKGKLNIKSLGDNKNFMTGNIMSFKGIGGMKIKLIIACCAFGFVVFMTIITAIASKDNANLDLTNKSSMSSSGGVRICTPEEIENKLIYLGDSRIVGMQQTINKENVTYIAESGMGYNWLVNTARGELDSLLNEDSNKIVVLALGANGLDASNYVTYYSELFAAYPSTTFFIMSVNPVDESKTTSNGYTITNSQIEEFNAEIKQAFPDKYIDSYNGVSDYNSGDGVHYDGETNKRIHDYIISSLKSSNKVSCGGGDLSFNSTYSDGNARIVPGQVYSSEPDPSGAINYWKNYLNPNDFVYPADDATGLSLGAWPKDYQSIPTQLSGYNEHNGFVWPTTPMNDMYTFVYEHNGIDIMAPVGTPIYSPVDGTIEYSEWGHTVNKGSDETAYSVSIKLDSPISYGGVNISKIFLTHMSGIRYRCNNCNQRVVKGELLGFVGNAAGTASGVGWAPHLHMTMYENGYSNGLSTSKIEKLYNISPNTVRRAGE